jgi:hypothetical protein
MVALSQDEPTAILRVLDDPPDRLVELGGALARD